MSKGKRIATFFLGFAVALLIIFAIVLVMLVMNPRAKQAFSSFVNGFEAGYEYAEFSKYNSPAEENGLAGKAIYICANDISNSSYNSQNPNYSYFMAKEKNGEWLLVTSLMNSKQDLHQALKGAKTVFVYGYYWGYSSTNNAPAMMATQIIVDNKVYSMDTSFLE